MFYRVRPEHVDLIEALAEHHDISRQGALNYLITLGAAAYAQLTQQPEAQ